jgi:hypothetical protein
MPEVLRTVGPRARACALAGAGGTGRQAMRKKIPPQASEGLALLLTLVVALGLLVNAAVALWVGLHDVLWPVSLSAQLVGFFYLIAGLASLAGFIAIFPLLGKEVDVTDQPDSACAGHDYLLAPVLEESGRLTDQSDSASAGHEHLLARIAHDLEESTRQLQFVAAAAVAGLYIDLTIVFYSFHYRPRYVWIFSPLAVLCACVACVTLLGIWQYLGKTLKAVGISLAGLAAVAQFFYQSVYIPENTQVGIDYGLTLGSMTRSGSARLVQVNLTMKDESSVTAVTLGSMVVVRGISYPSKKSMVQKITVLRSLQPIQNNDFLFPNDTYSYDFLVVVTDPGIEALNFGLTLYYARTTGLEFRNPILTQEHLWPCPDGKQFEWPIEESELRNFTEGPQVLYSDWCAGPKVLGDPSVNVRMGTPATESAMGSLINVSSRDYTLTLGGESNP